MPFNYIGTLKYYTHFFKERIIVQKKKVEIGTESPRGIMSLDKFGSGKLLQSGTERKILSNLT